METEEDVLIRVEAGDFVLLPAPRRTWCVGQQCAGVLSTPGCNRIRWTARGTRHAGPGAATRVIGGFFSSIRAHQPLFGTLRR